MAATATATMTHPQQDHQDHEAHYSLHRCSRNAATPRQPKHATINGQAYEIPQGTSAASSERFALDLVSKMDGAELVRKYGLVEVEDGC